MSRAGQILVGMVAALSTCVAMAASPPPLIEATNPQAILDVAKGYGSATLETRDGDPRIAGRISGIKYFVLFYGCKSSGKCTDIQFSTGWTGYKVTLEQVNGWNRDKRFGKAYLDNENDPRLEMEVNLDHGVTRNNLDDSFDWWRIALEEFSKKVLGD